MRWSHPLFLCAGIIFSLPAAGSCVVTDDAGHRLELSKPATRLIVLAPDLVENVFAIGAGGRVIGVVQGSDYPAAVRRIPQVGSYSGIDLERIVAMQPDLIVAWKYAFPRQLTALQSLGIPVFVAAPKQLDDVPRLLRQLGCLTAQGESAAVAADQFAKEVEQLRQQAAGKTRLKVFFQIDRHALLTVNKDSWITQVLTLCGGQNIFSNAKTVAPEVSREAILVANPDVILNDSFTDDWKKSWQDWPEMTAVSQKKLYTIAPDWISRAGPRLVKGARQVCDSLAAARQTLS
jgi:iron complex transport system substrate-binding protein